MERDQSTHSEGAPLSSESLPRRVDTDPEVSNQSLSLDVTEMLREEEAGWAAYRAQLTDQASIDNLAVHEVSIREGLARVLGQLVVPGVRLARTQGVHVLDGLLRLGTRVAKEQIAYSNGETDLIDEGEFVLAVLPLATYVNSCRALDKPSDSTSASTS